MTGKTLLICGFGAGMERSVAELLALGHTVLALTDAANPVLCELGVEILLADPRSPAAAVRAISALVGSDIDGVFSLGCDNPETVSAVATVLGCRSLSQEAAERCSRKDLRLHCLRAAGLRTPKFRVARTLDEAVAASEALGFPVIVKPSDNTGSHGVLLADSPARIRELAAEALGHSASHTLVIEQFLIGTEHTVTGFCDEGRVVICGFADRAYSEKFRFAPYVFESGDTLPSALSTPLQDEVKSVVIRAVAALQLDPAFFNTDVLVTAEGHVYLLEITGRVTGARIATEVMRLSSGVDPLPNLVRLAVGEPLAWDELTPTRSIPVVQRFRPSEGGVVEAVGKIEFPPGIHDLFWCIPVERGMTLPSYRSADDVLAGVIVSASSIEVAENIAHNALRTLPITISDSPAGV